MKRLTFFLLVSASAVLSSCTTTRPVISSVDASQIDKLLLLEPLTYISLIEKGDHAEPSDSLSYESAVLISDLVRNVPGMPSITEAIVPVDDSLRCELEAYFTLLDNTRPEKRHELLVPPVVTALLDAGGHRFGLAFLTEGFSRKKGNYGRQIAKGLIIRIAVVILTGGMVDIDYLPVKSRSDIHCVIIDAQTGSAIFYNRHLSEVADPVNINDISKQLGKIFKRYLGRVNTNLHALE
jgi:hypothetical protein